MKTISRPTIQLSVLCVLVSLIIFEVTVDGGLGGDFLNRVTELSKRLPINILVLIILPIVGIAIRRRRLSHD